jgi:hypothetical protein
VAVVLACSALAWSQDAGFHDGFDEGDTSGWWAPARVGETGQVTCYDEQGAVIDCEGTGHEGDSRPGVAWPVPRFVDNLDGTVVDRLTGLVWLRDASCSELDGTNSQGKAPWTIAVASAGTLADGMCGLSDGSEAGWWRLPGRFELESLLDLEYRSPALSDAAGTGQWSEGDPFSGVMSGFYWTSTSNAYDPLYAWHVRLDCGCAYGSLKPTSFFVWPVRNPRVTDRP